MRHAGDGFAIQEDVIHAFRMAPRPRPTVETTSRVVGANCSRIRTEMGLTLAQLSERLGEAGRPLGAATLSELERGVRRASVDDLTSLAAVLEVSPIALLMPHTLTGDSDPATLTGVTAEIGAQLLEWLRGEAPVTDWGLEPPTPAEAEARIRFRRRSLPPWAWS